MRILLIDDCRIMDVDRIARNYIEGIRALQEEKWDLLYLDHDMGLGPTGYDVLLWLELFPEFLPKEILLVTQNPVGRHNMQQILDRLYKGE